MNTEQSKCDALLAFPMELQSRICRGLYGGEIQYYISGVDGTLAQLGDDLPSEEALKERR